jgi:hypothetical protein
MIEQITIYGSTTTFMKTQVRIGRPVQDETNHKEGQGNGMPISSQDLTYHDD